MQPNPQDPNIRNFPFKLASVCRRFRTIALSAPQLWGGLSSSFRTKQEALDLRLQRSQNADLEIHVGVFPSVLYREESICLEWLNSFRTSTMVHCQRWVSLDITLSSKRHPAALEAVMNVLSKNGVALPRLRSLAIPGIANPGNIFQIMGRRAPNLRSISMKVGDTLTENLKLPKSVTRLTIEKGRREIKVHYLAAILRSAPIEELTLDFSSYCSDFTCQTVEYGGKQKTVQFAIASVKSLDLSFPSTYEFDVLLEGLHFPGLERLALSICDPVDEDYGVRRGRGHDMYDYEVDGDYDDYGGGGGGEYFYDGPATVIHRHMRHHHQMRQR